MGWVIEKGKAVYKGTPIKETNTRAYVFRVTPTGGVNTNKRTGVRTVYKTFGKGPDRVMRIIRTLPPLKKPRLTGGRVHRVG